MKVKVSNGELVDKAAILKVKLEKIKDQKKLNNINTEYQYLLECMSQIGVTEDSSHFKDLFAIHLINWDLIETWNSKEKSNEFDEEYIEVTKKSNQCNRERFKIKSDLNQHSEIVEEKSEIYD